MKLPTRVRAHEFHPEGIYRIAFGDTPLIWCVSKTNHDPQLPFLGNTDHWYSDPAGPPLLGTINGAGTLSVTEVSAGNFNQNALWLHQAYNTWRFTTPQEVPANQFQPGLGGSFANRKAFVLDRNGACFDQHGSVSRLAILFSNGATQDPRDFSVAFAVLDDPNASGADVSFGAGILGAPFTGVGPNSNQHPNQWATEFTFSAP